jgi:hypothetical protein
VPQPKSVDPTKSEAAIKVINFRLTPAMYEFLAAKSRKEGKTISSLVRDRIDFNRWKDEA